MLFFLVISFNFFLRCFSRTVSLEILIQNQNDFIFVVLEWRYFVWIVLSAWQTKKHHKFLSLECFTVVSCFLCQFSVYGNLVLCSVYALYLKVISVSFENNYFLCVCVLCMQKQKSFWLVFRKLLGYMN